MATDLIAAPARAHSAVVPSAVANDTTVHASLFQGRTSIFTQTEAEGARWSEVVACLFDRLPVYEVGDLVPKAPGSPDYRKPADLPLIAFAKFYQGERARETVEAVYTLGYDYDAAGATLQGAKDAFPGVLGLVHPSFNHRPDKPALRVFLVASRPMTADEYDLCWAVGQRKLGVDQGEDAKDASRWFYVPAVIEGRPAPTPTTLDGQPFDVDEWLAEAATLGVTPRAPASSSVRVAQEHDDGCVSASDGADYDAAIKRARHLCQTHPKSLRATSPERAENPDSYTGETRMMMLMGDLRHECELSFDDAYRIQEEEYQPRHLPSDFWTDEGELRRKYDEAGIGNRVALRSPAHSSKFLESFGKAKSTPTSELAPVPIGPTPNEPKMYFSGFAGWHSPPAPVGWLIKDVIPAASVGVMYGPPGCNKTFLAVSMAIAISQGKPWCGRITSAGECQTGWIDYENGAAEAYRRVGLLGGLDAKDFLYQPCPDELLADEAFWDRLPRTLKFLIIDTLARGSIGIEENSKDAANPIYAAQRFRDETGCAVLILHHSLKSNEEMYRGSTAVEGAVDYMCFVRKNGDDLTLISKKFRNGQPPKDVEVRLMDNVGMIARNGATDPDADWKPSVLDARILKYLDTKGVSYPSKEDITGKGSHVTGGKTEKRERLEHLISKGRVYFSRTHKGYALDSAELRELRILDAVRLHMQPDQRPLTTAKNIADAAETPTYDVERLIGNKILKNAGGGGYMTNEEPASFFGRAKVVQTRGNG